MFKGIYGASIFVKDQASEYSFARELVDADCTVAIMKQNRMKVPVESIYNINNKEQWKKIQRNEGNSDRRNGNV